MGARIVSYLL